jgi:hypothetical protein
MKFSKLLIQWYLQNKSDLLWEIPPIRTNLALRNHVTADPCAQGTHIFCLL